ncbi:MAG: hypothetical protein KJO11_11820 [Gemmatimonadetes bacterium]|nr:hypothetical protein [Gemmatimonadota bacterium]NNF38851.1 hypothetical protein [Gemmatimonadota bacterium]NNK62360.1 hypothetical protein [Gemmatimonadota bacterium]
MSSAAPDGAPGRTGARAPGENPGRRRPEQAGPVCELCGMAMLDRHCKVVCLNCGYKRDCSDP